MTHKHLLSAAISHAQHSGAIARARRTGRYARRLAGAAWLATGLLAPWAAAGSPEVTSGRYEGGLHLAVAPSDRHRLTGHLAVEGTPCRIYLHGLPHGERYRVAVLAPGARPFVGYGELSVRLDGPVPRVRLDAPLPHACQPHLAPLSQRWWALETAQPWQAIRLVQAKRARFHDEPHDVTARKAYVVQWDVVAIDKETPDFAHALFLGGQKPVSGWLRQEDTYPAEVTPEMAYVRDQWPPMEGRWPAGGLPIEVRAYLNARERCEHFGGEEGTDPARRKFLQAAMARECGDAARRYKALLAAHAGQQAETAFLQRNAPPQ